MTAFSKEIALVFGAGAAALITAMTWYQYQKRKNVIPDKWLEVGSVGDLWIYPLKSGAAVPVKEAECTDIGPVIIDGDKFPLTDRGFLIFTEKQKEHRTGRNHPEMILINVSAVSQWEIKLEAPGMSSLIINTLFENPDLVSCSLGHGEPVTCIDCGDDAAKWISQYCTKSDSSLRLGMYAGWKRSITVEPWKALPAVYKNLTEADLGTYTDMATYHICNQASVEDLNEKLPFEVTAAYFRPNITVVGPKAFAEDNWDWIRVGEDVVFRNVRPCGRCMLINLDCKTGKYVPKQAILRKLQEYRLATDKKQRKVEGNSPVMGIYTGIRRPGQIKLGDRVYVG